MSLAFPPDTDTPGYEAEMRSKVGVGVIGVANNNGWNGSLFKWLATS